MPSNQEQPSPPALLVRSSGMTLLHRIQRSWPLVRLGRPITNFSIGSELVSSLPYTKYDTLSAQVELENVRQGTFRSEPATLLLFEASIACTGPFIETSIELRLSHSNFKTRASSDKAPLYIAAFGPARITEPPEPGVSTTDQRELATVEMVRSPRGALLVVRSREQLRRIFPRTLQFGVVVVHKEPGDLRVLPSTTCSHRLKAFRRAKVRPINLDIEDELGKPIVTCAQQPDGGCHPSCKEFGPEHMTSWIWEQNLTKYETRYYIGDPPDNGWSAYL